MTVNWDGFARVIEQHQNILLTSHIRPDCDALGSELGMAGVLDKLGKSVRIVNGDDTPVSNQSGTEKGTIRRSRERATRQRDRRSTRQ